MSKCPYREWSVHDRQVEYKCVGGKNDGCLCDDEWSEHHQCEWVKDLNKVLGHSEKKLTVLTDHAIRKIVEYAHMAGQLDAGVDPGYSNARAYCDKLFASEKD